MAHELSAAVRGPPTMPKEKDGCVGARWMGAKAEAEMRVRVRVGFSISGEPTGRTPSH